MGTNGIGMGDMGSMGSMECNISPTIVNELETKIKNITVYFQKSIVDILNSQPSDTKSFKNLAFVNDYTQALNIIIKKSQDTQSQISNCIEKYKIIAENNQVVLPPQTNTSNVMYNDTKVISRENKIIKWYLIFGIFFICLFIYYLYLNKNSQ